MTKPGLLTAAKMIFAPTGIISTIFLLFSIIKVSKMSVTKDYLKSEIEEE